MFRSLHMKLAMVLIILIVSTMTVAGAFLLNSVSTQNTEDFTRQMNNVFTQEFILTLERTAESNDIAALRQVMEAYASRMGVDQDRMFFILSGTTGQYLAGSDDTRGEALALSENMISALSGKVGQTVDRLGETFDIAIPLRSKSGEVLYIVGVSDNKASLNDLTWSMLSLLIRAIFFALVVAIMLSFLLSKTITTPVERLTHQASKIAAGDFGERAQAASNDEIGTLTETFNDMADTLQSTIREVENERNKLSTLFKHMADGVVAFDSKGKLLHINPAAEKMLGKNISADMTYSEIFPNISADKEALSEDGRSMELDYIAGPRVLKMQLAPIMMGDGKQGIMAVLHDITEQQKLDADRREFVANVSHELHTPLTNIKGYTETLIDSGDSLDSETRNSFLTVVYNESDRMSRIVKDLLTLSRLDSNRMEMKMVKTDIAPAVNSAVRSMLLEAENQQLTLKCEIAPELACVRGDHERIEQVILNLISNAVKYNRPGGSVDVKAYSKDGFVFVAVADTGLGVPKEDLPRVFERFYRVDKARSRKRGGTGLGLAISKQITEAHGGDITFDSVYGQGSTVTLRLPIYKEADNG